jgi:uncharacterized protein (UPF0335 family)
MTAHIAHPVDLRKAAIIFSDGKVSTARLQREMSIGYNKAALIVENLQAAKVVSSPDHVGKRTLIDAEALDRLANGETMVAARLAGRPAPAPEFIKAADDMARKGRPPMAADPDFKKHNQDAYAVTADELRQFIERFEQMESEKKDIADQQKELMGEAKGRGYDTKVMRKVIAMRKRKPDELAEEEAVLDLYKTALGMT